jgi:hypothetical protein
MFFAESFQQMKKTAKFYRKSLEINFYLQGHNGVSETGSLLRERLGAFPFDVEDEVLFQIFKPFFS